MKGKTDKSTLVIKPLAIRKPSRDVGKLVSKKWKKEHMGLGDNPSSRVFLGSYLFSLTGLYKV